MTDLERLLTGSPTQPPLLSDECWFCSKKTPDRLTVDLYRDVSSKIGLGGTTFRWEETHRSIPRCIECKVLHEMAAKAAKTRAWKWALLILAGFAAPPIILAGIFGLPASEKGIETIEFLCFVWGAACLTTLGIVCTLTYRGAAESVMALSPDVKPRAYLFRHPTIALLTAAGWKEGKPSKDKPERQRL